MGQLGNVSQASQIFGYGRDTFYRFVCQHRIRVQLRKLSPNRVKAMPPPFAKGGFRGISLPAGGLVEI